MTHLESYLELTNQVLGEIEHLSIFKVVDVIKS